MITGYSNRHPAYDTLDYSVLNTLDNYNNAGQMNNSTCFILNTVATKHNFCKKNFLTFGVVKKRFDGVMQNL